MRTSFLAAFAFMAVGVPAAAQAPQTRTTISIGMADTLVDAAAKEAAARKVDVSIVVVDEQGDIVLARRMDRALPHSFEIALRKAKTSALTRQPTKVIQDAVTQGGNIIMAIDDIMPIEGGFPVFHQGKLLGAIGASGATSHVDAAVAQAGIDALSARAEGK